MQYKKRIDCNMANLYFDISKDKYSHNIKQSADHNNINIASCELMY